MKILQMTFKYLQILPKILRHTCEHFQVQICADTCIYFDIVNFDIITNTSTCLQILRYTCKNLLAKNLQMTSTYLQILTYRLLTNTYTYFYIIAKTYKWLPCTCKYKQIPPHSSYGQILLHT